MRLFVTGASGWIGAATVSELLDAGHRVVGLARSDSAAARVAALGAEVRRGDLDDLDGLRAAAADADGVIHLGYNHDFSRMADAARTDLSVINTLGEALAGSDRPLVMASGIIGLAAGRVATEHDVSDPGSGHPRSGNAAVALSFAERGVRPVAVRFAPTVHGAGDHGFIATLVEVAREKGVAGYLGDGANRWPAVHRQDAAALVRLAVESAPAGATLHAVAEEGIATRTIAEAIGQGLGLPVAAVPVDHFGWIGRFFGSDMAASSTVTRELLGWKPVHPTLLEDLASGAYFAS